MEIDSRRPPTPPSSSGKVNKNSQQKASYKPGFIRLFFACLEGYDSRYSGIEIQYGGKNAVFIRASLLISSLFAFAAAFLFFDFPGEAEKHRGMLALSFVMTTFSVNLFVVTAPKIHYLGIIVRFVLSVILSVIISTQILLAISQGTINVEVQKRLTSDRNAGAMGGLTSKLSATQKQLDETESDLQGLHKLLDDYFDYRMAQLRSIEDVLLAMKAEEEGRGRSAKKGRGVLWAHLNTEKRRLESQATSLQENIEIIKARINQIRENQGSYRKQAQDLEAKLQALSKKYDPSIRNDLPFQTEILHQIVVNNPVSLIERLSLFLLVFFIDVAPLLIRLIAKIDYGETNRAPKTVSDLIALHARSASLRGCLMVALGAAGYFYAAGKLHFEPNPAVLWVALSIGLVLLTDYALLKLRVAMGWYGSNAIEALEIARFLHKYGGSAGGGKRDILRHRSAPGVARAATMVEGGPLVVANSAGGCSWQN